MTENNSYNAFPGNNSAPYSPPNSASQWAYQSQSIPTYTAPTPVYVMEPPLDQPWYGIGFGQAFVRFWKKYATFSGRASRSEYWWSYLALTLINLGLSFFGIIPVIGVVIGFISLIFGLATFIPSLAIAVRRLHDTNRSGWWLLLPYGLIFIGLIIFFATFIPVMFELGLQGSNVENMTDEEAFELLMPMLGGMIVYLIFIFAGIIVEIVLMALPSKPEGVRFDKQAPAQAVPMTAQALPQGYNAYPNQQPYTQSGYSQQSYGQTDYSQQSYSQPDYGQQQWQPPTGQLPTGQQSSEAQPPYSPM